MFAAVDRADQKYDVDPAVATKRKELNEHLKALTDRKKEVDDRIVGRAGKPLADLESKIATLKKASKESEAFGYHSAIEKQQDTAKWVQVDLGRPYPLQSIVLHPCKDDFNGIGEGFGFPPRFKVELSNDGTFAKGVERIADHTGQDFPNPKLLAQVVNATGRSAQFYIKRWIIFTCQDTSLNNCVILC